MPLLFIQAHPEIGHPTNRRTYILLLSHSSNVHQSFGSRKSSYIQIMADNQNLRSTYYTY
jgi:hypothetical protein